MQQKLFEANKYYLVILKSEKIENKKQLLIKLLIIKYLLNNVSLNKF